MSERQPSANRGERLQYLAALAGAGILAAGFGADWPQTAGASPREAAKIETVANEDRMSRQINREMGGILKDLRTLVRHRVKHAHHQRFNSYGKTVDRYYYTAAGEDLNNGTANWVQVIGVIQKGAKIPESCAIMYGVPNPDHIVPSYYMAQFMARDPSRANSYALENIFKNDNGKWVEAYFNKNGNHYNEKSRVGHHGWHQKPLTAGKVMQNYEDFTSSTDELLKIAVSKIAPSTGA